MIFTTVIVSCLFALLGVFQSSIVDTFLSSLAHLNTPTLSSVTTFLQVAGSITRLALDAAPFPKVDQLALGQLSTSSIGDSLTNLNIPLQDLPTGLNATLTPAVGVPGRAPTGFWYSLVNLFIRAGLLFLSYVLFKFAWSQLIILSTESDAGCPPATDQRHNSANPPHLEHHPGLGLGLFLSHEPDSYYNPLSFVSPASLQDPELFPTPPPAFIPPAISLVLHLGDAELTCAFGVPRPPYTSSETAEEPHTNDDDSYDYDKYLMDALTMPDPDAPPTAGWCCDDEFPPAARPSQDTLDAWILPRIPPGEDPPLAEGSEVGDVDEG